MKKLKTIFLQAPLILLTTLLSSCQTYTQKPEVVVYVCVDQVYAEPILKDFEKKTGIKTLAVYDVEATKTSGMVNRLIAEKKRPQADVFWNNEFAQTFLLKEQGVLAPYSPVVKRDGAQQFRDEQGFWTSFGGRARVILVNKKLVSKNEYPKSIYDLLDAKWSADKIAISSPVFGTSATHAAAIYALLGPGKAKQFYQDLADRRVRILDGNSVVKDLVVNGQLLWGMVDSDDAFVALKESKDVEIIFPDQDTIGTLIIPSTVSFISGARHPEQAKALINYLLEPEIEQKLVSAGLWLADPHKVRSMDVKASEIMLKAQAAREDLKNIFVR